LPVLMKPVVLLTVIGTEAVPPATTEKVVVPPVGAMVKLSVVAVSVRLRVVDSDAVLGPLAVPVTVTVWVPSAMLGAVVMVSVTVDGDAGEPVSGALGWLKLQAAPVGSPVQLVGVKFTEPVKPLAGVRVIVETAGCPALTLKVAGLAEIAKGAVTVTFVGPDVDGLFDVSP
jgi:hypothetical protein